MLTISYHTLGCKVNQYETEKIREALEAAGFKTVPFGSRADVCVINTCSVTHVADGKSRSAIRRALKANPDAYIVVTGCYSELEPSHVRAIEGVDLVARNDEKESIPERIAARLAEGNHTATSPRHSALPRVRTRAIVKVQDGCDQFCAYCIVPHARPGKRSRPMEDALAEIRSLAEFGYREIVLTGIRLGSYADGESRLPELIRAVADVEGVERIRLSSIEPWEVDDALLDAVAHPKVCRHLHIPLQSGDDAVLERMGRPYSRARYMDIITRVRERIPGIGITTDVIAGFPGETEAEFENTCGVVEEAAFSRLHVFRYSPRKRTRAAEMTGQVDASTKKARADRLSEMGALAVRRFAESMVGLVVEVLVERQSRHIRSDGNHLTGFADNYVEVTFPGDASLVGSVARVRIVGVDQHGRALGNAD
jgi:threonylcarbamoyladenosine tRNA methylthiotransferase MtaB